MQLPSVQLVAPFALLLLLALPVWWIIRARKRPPAITFSRTSTLARGPHVGSSVERVLFILRNIVLAGLVLAMARPRGVGHTENVTSQGINIVLVIDLSSSMLAEDFQPSNRIAVAKATVKRFIAGRSSDRIGLVAFGRSADPGSAHDRLSGRDAGSGQPAGWTVGRWNGNRYGDSDRRQQASECARKIASDDPADRRGQQPR